jgi:hypothetical protein
MQHQHRDPVAVWRAVRIMDGFCTAVTSRNRRPSPPPCCSARRVSSFLGGSRKTFPWRNLGALAIVFFTHTRSR